MIAVEQEQQLNDLTDQLLKRGLALTKMDARRLAESMMFGESEQKKYVDSISESMDVDAGLETLNKRPERAQPQTHLHKKVDEHATHIQSLQEQVHELKEENAKLHQTHHQNITALQEQIKQLLRQDVQEEKDNPTTDELIVDELIEQPAQQTQSVEKAQVKNELDFIQTRTPLDEVETQEAEQELEKKEQPAEADVDLSDIFFTGSK
ncbi:MAG: hypothetical protein ACMXYF_00835 [Candidatus Woesearchaeota archaeon]